MAVPSSLPETRADSIDDGFLCILDREKDMIVSAG